MRADAHTTANCFETLADWVEAVHGHGEVSAALDEFVLLFKCDAAILVRFAEGSQHPFCLVRALSEENSEYLKRCGFAWFDPKKP